MLLPLVAVQAMRGAPGYGAKSKRLCVNSMAWSDLTPTPEVKNPKPGLRAGKERLAPGWSVSGTLVPGATPRSKTAQRQGRQALVPLGAEGESESQRTGEASA